MIRQTTPRTRATSPADASVCLDCGTSLVGEYCHVCGQRRLTPEQRRLVPFLKEALRHLTNLDGRLLRSLGFLLLLPGRLLVAFIAGSRRRYLSPIALFLTVNLVYFVSPTITDLNLGLEDQYVQHYGEWARVLVDRRLAEGADATALERAFNAQSLNVGKLLVILHVPVFALVLALLLPWRHLHATDHLAAGLYLAAFLLASLVLALLLGTGAIMATQYLAGEPAMVIGAVRQLWLVAVIAWTIHLLRRGYGTSWWGAAWRVPLLLMGAMAGHVYFYRPLHFLITFWTA
ncbi:MAG: DUF3667 domain-containing protein [Xanthomonadales bacterium]|nr:DUF3667 domain-containing protein [Xanthomonadales bacterium]